METVAEPADLTMEQAISRAIETMNENIGDPLTMDDIARAAMYSKFHFSREFQRVTGVSPGRYLSAVRLQAAKRLLISTSLTVTEISHRVGYTSVGTFSTRFTSSVGLAPTTYRRLGGIRGMVRNADSPGREQRSGIVRGQVRAPAAEGRRLIFVSLWPTRIPLGRPVSCAILHRPGPFLLDDVPLGTWYLLGYSAPATRNGMPTVDQAQAVGDSGPVEVRGGVPLQPVDLRLRAVRDLDPPVLPALPDARAAAIQNGADD